MEKKDAAETKNVVENKNNIKRRKPCQTLTKQAQWAKEAEPAEEWDNAFLKMETLKTILMILFKDVELDSAAGEKDSEEEEEDLEESKDSAGVLETNND